MVIGAGPAGLAAALQLIRQGQQPVVLEKARPGGLLHNANLVENYPGFPGGISGPDLVARFLDQAETVGVKITPAEVTAADFARRVFRIVTGQGEMRSRILVIASGTNPIPYRDVEIPERVQSRIYYDITPLSGQTGKEILILGAGDAALDYALNLSRSNRVVIYHRGENIKGLQLLWERVKNQRIAFLPCRRITEFQWLPEGKFAVTSQHQGQREERTFDYLVPAIGRRPADSFLTQGLRDKTERLQQGGRLYFIGDVRNGHYRQTAIAVGDGLRAAMRIGRKFEEEKV